MDVEKISNALLHKFVECGANSFSITMKKSQNTYTITRRFTAPYKSCGHWHGRSAYFVVTGDRIDGEKPFKSFDTMAKAIAAGYIK